MKLGKMDRRGGMKRTIAAAAAALAVLLAGCSSPARATVAAVAVSTSESSPPSVRPTEPTVAFEGTGDDVVDVPTATSIRLLTFDCPACTGNTVLKSNGAESLLVNEIGAYHGRHLIDVRDGSATSRLTVTAEGSWSISIEDWRVIVNEGKTSGTGDDAIYLNEGSKVALTHDGEANFAVWTLSGSSIDLAVNTIGSYRGTVPMDAPAVLMITADGAWTAVAS